MGIVNRGKESPTWHGERRTSCREKEQAGLTGAHLCCGATPFPATRFGAPMRGSSTCSQLQNDRIINDELLQTA